MMTRISPFSIVLLLAAFLVPGGSEAFGQDTRMHTVETGDTLFRIAEKYGMTVAELQRLNQVEGTGIRVGQQLLVRDSGSERPDDHPDGAHIVSAGETLFSIAHDYGIPVDSLLARNVVRPGPLSEGEALILPEISRTTSHRVRPGETLAALGRHYNTTPSAIREANNLRSDQINIGQVLEIPSGSGSIPESAPPATKTGRVTVYPDMFEGRFTASGERYDPDRFTASHRQLPMGTILLLINPANGRQTFARINDRGPLEDEYLLDVSSAVIGVLELQSQGEQEIEIRVVQ